MRLCVSSRAAGLDVDDAAAEEGEGVLDDGVVGGVGEVGGGGGWTRGGGLLCGGVGGGVGGRGFDGFAGVFAADEGFEWGAVLFGEEVGDLREELGRAGGVATGR